MEGKGMGRVSQGCAVVGGAAAAAPLGLGVAATAVPGGAA